jgi:hypothetical protein
VSVRGLVEGEDAADVDDDRAVGHERERLLGERGEVVRIRPSERSDAEPRQLLIAAAELRRAERLLGVATRVAERHQGAEWRPEAANLMFSLVSSRYERASLIVTSNKPFGSWGEIFGDEIVAAAMIDRLVHHSEIVALKGDSYRLKDKDLSSPQPAQRAGLD